MLEKRGNLRQARDLLLRAWGASSDSYEVTMRLAWLSLRLGDLDNARRFYEAATKMPEAEPEAPKGTTEPADSPAQPAEEGRER